MATPFSTALNFIIEKEGGVSDHPADSGGLTNKGITQHTYNVFRFSEGRALRPVTMIEDSEVEKIYHDLYWQEAKCHLMSHRLSLLHFDAAVQHGVRTANKILQRAVGVKDDGVIGPITLGAIAQFDEVDIIAAYLAERKEFYRRIIEKDPSQKVFERGWKNRMASLERVVVA